MYNLIVKKKTSDPVSRNRARPDVADACEGSTLGADPALYLENQLCFALYATSLAMTKAYRPWLAEIGITYPQYVVLLALGQSDGLTVTALGERVLLESGTLTPLLKRLQKAGLVERARNPLDERQVLVSLTPAGRTAYQSAGAIRQRAGCATGLSADSARKLTRSLGKLRTVLAQTAAQATDLGADR